MSLFPTEEQRAHQRGYEKGYEAGAKAAREDVLVEILDMSHGVWNLPDMQERIRKQIKYLRSQQEGR